MSARVFVIVDSEEEAQAWETALGTLGLRIVGRPSDALSGEGWTVRAVSPDVARKRYRRDLAAS